MPRRLFTVPRAGRSVAVVLAREFTDAISVAAWLPAVGSVPANERLELFPVTMLYARRPTVDERRRFAVTASRLRDEVALAELAP